ncbi:DUF805 domain-containing protein [Streptacidiphilus rugosus]|uniref:DUF805 domain-containing protein n=1 Tax=Streptacidiphilus rugosus TaxID=405783 RepID=UPI000561CF5E|nr:DUF805 domain-containing protein [Streptacidiphilus rugosus]
MNWYLAVIKNYVGFSGRARRQEFWMFFLFNAIIEAVLYAVDSAIGSPILVGIYGLAVLLPYLAVAIRRLHDTGRSGWWLLIALTCVGYIALLVFWATEGEAAENSYGANPKLAPAPAV